MTDIRAALAELARAYVRLLETGRDRIISAGGDCDPVDVMEESDPALIAARAALAEQPAQPIFHTYDKENASTQDRIAWVLCQIIDDDAPMRWTRYRFVAGCIASNERLLADLRKLADEQAVPDYTLLVSWPEGHTEWVECGGPALTLAMAEQNIARGASRARCSALNIDLRPTP